MKVFYKMAVPLWMCLATHAQSTQDNKVSISLQFLKENLKDEVDFFYQQINIKGFFKLILSF